MSPKAQRPLRGAKSLSSPSSRPSGEASVPPPPAGKIPAVLHEEMDRGVDMSIVRMLDWESSKIKVFWRLGFMLFRKEFFSFPQGEIPTWQSIRSVWLASAFCLN